MRRAGRCVALQSAGLRSWGRKMRERQCLARLILRLLPEVAVLPKGQKSLVKVLGKPGSRASGTGEAEHAAAQVLGTCRTGCVAIGSGITGAKTVWHSVCARLQRRPASTRWQSRLLVACVPLVANRYCMC